MVRRTIALSFAGSGHLLCYQLGAAQALLNRSEWASRISAYAGASGGAIAATVCALLPDRVAEFAESVACKGYGFNGLSEALHGKAPRFVISDGDVRRVSEEQRLFLSVTHCRTGRNALLSRFASAAQLQRCVLASAAIPQSFHPLDMTRWRPTYPEAGGVIVAGRFMPANYPAVAALVGLIGATLAALGLRLDRSAIKNGLFGYNGVLVGIGLATVLDGEWDGAVCDVGTSRWFNYYVHGLLWSTSHAPHIDGIYYDGINFDRRSMQRVRKVLDAGAGSRGTPLIDMSEADERLSDATELAKLYGQSLPSTRPQTAASRPQTASSTAATPGVGPSPAGGRAKSGGTLNSPRTCAKVEPRRSRSRTKLSTYERATASAAAAGASSSAAERRGASADASGCANVARSSKTRLSRGLRAQRTRCCAAR